MVSKNKMVTSSNYFLYLHVIGVNRFTPLYQKFIEIFYDLLEVLVIFECRRVLD